MSTSDSAPAREQSPHPPDADDAARQSMARLLRPYRWSFAAVVILQAIGAVAGLTPLLAVIELGRSLLVPGPVDHDHVWFIAIAGAVGLLVRLLFTAASSGIGHLLDGQVQLALRRHLVLSPPFVLLVVLIGGTALITNGGLPPADLPPFLLLGLGLASPVAALITHSFDDLQKCFPDTGGT